MRKKLLALVLALAMVVSLMVVPVGAEETASGTCGDNLTWVLDSDGTLTISGTGEMEDWSGDTSVPWYHYRTDITSVTIGNGVTSIGAYAFYRCTSLTNITIPDSVTSIGKGAFHECTSLTSVGIPDSVTSISNYTFYCCTSLTSITIPDSVISIGNSVLSYCTSLTSITIPDSVTSIGVCAFQNCTSLASISIPDGVTSIAAFAFFGCSGLTSITIPDSVISIGNQAFYGCTNLSNITIPNSVTSIDVSAFGNCTSLASVTIPDSVTGIGSEIFKDCTSLTCVTIGNGITSISGHMFSGCTNLTSITIPNSVTSIGNYAFDGCTSLSFAYYAGTEESWNDIDIGTYNTYLTDVVRYGLTEIETALYDEDEGSYVSEYDELNVDDVVSFSVEVTVPADTAVTFSKSNWVCTDEDGEESDAVTFDALSVLGPYDADEDGHYKTYYVSVTATLNDYGIYTVTFNSPLGASVSAELELPGYNWIFGEDNFCFTNNRSYFGGGSYYIEDEMFYAYLDTLNNTQITRMAEEFGSYSMSDRFGTLLGGEERYYRLFNFLNNDLKSFGGSCYGMSLVATLIKTGNLSAEDLGAPTTYELEALKKGENSTLESILNLYQISQKTATVHEADWESVWDAASLIGDGEQPFLVYLNSSDGGYGHCVVCYGAETGDFSVHFLWLTECSMRLLIYDPNSAEEEYIYISDDFRSVQTSCDEYVDCTFEVFGIYTGAGGNTFVETMDIDHSVYLDVDNMFVYQYTIYSSDGSYAEVSDGTIVGGTLDANIVWTASVLADGEEVEAENEIYTVYLPDDAEYYRIVPAEGETLDALMTFDDFSINVSGTMESATIYADGTVKVAGAEGDLSIDVTLNNSDFDFVGIAGSADGDVTVYVSDESITVTGDLTDYVVENMNRDCETDGVSVEDDTDIKVTMENEAVVAYADLDGDGEYETEISDNDATNPFTDVNTGHYFYNAVLWAVDNGITSGTSETTFSPFLTAERCQVVTFLWRAAGCPEPTSTENPFTDVNEGDYFYNAVLWAVEKGITTGTSDTTFSPYNKCERCQVVTFLYRYFGQPEVTTTSNPFTDVDTDDYFYNAVLWAVDNGITTGTTETTFGPFVTCERCMVVTFLYRALGE